MLSQECTFIHVHIVQDVLQEIVTIFGSYKQQLDFYAIKIIHFFTGSTLLPLSIYFMHHFIKFLSKNENSPFMDKMKIF